MSHKNELRKIKKIVMNALQYGVDKSASMNEISKGRVSQIFNENKHLVFLSHELENNKTFVELRKVFNGKL